MTSAEATSETFKTMAPNLGKKFISINATTTNAADFITVTGLSKIEGVYIMSTNGSTVGAGTWATNIFTFSNGATGSKVWSGFAWGY